MAQSTSLQSDEMGMAWLLLPMRRDNWLTCFHVRRDACSDQDKPAPRGLAQGGRILSALQL
jgi:hypothetical protein